MDGRRLERNYHDLCTCQLNTESNLVSVYFVASELELHELHIADHDN